MYLRNATKRAAQAEKDAKRRARMVKETIDFRKLNTNKRKKKSKSPTQRNLNDDPMMDLDSIDASNYDGSSLGRPGTMESMSPSQLEKLRASGLRIEDNFSGLMSNTPEGSDEMSAQDIENRIQAQVAAAMQAAET